MAYQHCTDKCWKPVKCTKCGMNKAPVGRDGGYYSNGDCTSGECEGYREDPHPPHFWSKREYEECVYGYVEEED